MAKPITIRTTGPIHLEDLEPHRFEDLVRQLLYDFRDWQQLEPTGRTGADEGFDVRATERMETARATDEDDEDDLGESVASERDTRTWLVQCKRERTITPSKLAKYLNDLPKGPPPLYGVIFAAACDFSKAARDLYRTQTRDAGAREAYLWGKADIEDMLFQPKNDHLLFAYFGISLQTRRRSLKTEIRSKLATKRKALRLLSKHSPILVRDVSDERYPSRDPDKSKRRISRGRWDVLRYEGAFSDGLHFVWHRHFAFLDDDQSKWDFAETVDDGKCHEHEDPWREDNDDVAAMGQARSELWELWEAFPEQNRAWYEQFLVLPYENILDIDEHGDEFFKNPHVYTIPFREVMGPFSEYAHRRLQTIDRFSRRQIYPDDANRIEKFPRSDADKQTAPTSVPEPGGVDSVQRVEPKSAMKRRKGQ